MKKNQNSNVKFVTENGTFFLDYNHGGLLSVEDMINIDGLLIDIARERSKYHSSKEAEKTRNSKISKLLKE